MAGGPVVGTAATVSAEALRDCGAHPSARTLAQKPAPERALLPGPAAVPSTVTHFQERKKPKNPEVFEEQGRKVAPQAPWGCGEPNGGTCHMPSPGAT